MLLPKLTLWVFSVFAYCSFATPNLFPLKINNDGHKVLLGYQVNRITFFEVGNQGELDTIISMAHEEEIKQLQVLPDQRSFYVLHQDKEGTFSNGAMTYTYIDVTTMYRFEDGYVIKVFKKRNANLLGTIVLGQYIIRENGLVYTIDDEFVQSKYPSMSLFSLKPKTAYTGMYDTTYQRLKESKQYGTTTETFKVLRVFDNDTKILIDRRLDGSKKASEHQWLLCDLNPEFFIGNTISTITAPGDDNYFIWNSTKKMIYASEESKNVAGSIQCISFATGKLEMKGKSATKLHHICVPEKVDFLMGLDKSNQIQFFSLDNLGGIALTSTFTCKDASSANVVISQLMVLPYSNAIAFVGFGKPTKDATDEQYFYANLSSTGELSNWKSHTFAYIRQKEMTFYEFK